MSLGERRQLHPLHDNHLLNRWHIHVRCDLIVEEIAKERWSVAEVHVGSEETGSRAERTDAEVSDEGWSTRDPAREQTESAVVSVAEDVAAVVTRDLQKRGEDRNGEAEDGPVLGPPRSRRS